MLYQAHITLIYLTIFMVVKIEHITIKFTHDQSANEILRLLFIIFFLVGT